MQLAEKIMQNQWSNLELAPRDGFEPSTNRLTAIKKRISTGCTAFHLTA
jgi:hypothetical protein